MFTRRSLVVIGAAVIALVPAAPAAALLGFTAPVKLAVGGTPSVAMDSAGHLFIAYGRSGIHFMNNRTGGWVDRAVSTSTSSHVDGSPSLAMDKQGHAFITFSRFDLTLHPSRSVGIWLATNRTGSWVLSRLTTGSDYTSSVGVDGAGKVHVAYHRTTGTSSGIHYRTNSSGTWVDSLVAGKGAPYNPTLAVVGNTPYIVFARTQDLVGAPCGIYLWQKGAGATWVTGHWVGDHYSNEFTDCWGFESRPAVGGAKDGVHVMFSYAGTNPSPGMYNTYKDPKWVSQNYGSQGFGLVVGAAFTSSRIDTVTAQFNDCSQAPNCHNGLYYAKLTNSTGIWQGFTRQLTTRSDTCNQRGSTGTGPYSCDDQPSVELFNGKARVVFVRGGGSVEYMHD